MPDRLDELRRQRALISEHLAWLDREIAATDRGTTPPAAPAKPVPSVASPPAVAAPHSSPGTTLTPAAAPLPEFPEYQADPVTTESETRRGCLLAAALGMILFFAVLAGIYFAAYRDHPIFSAEKPVPRK